MTCQIPFNTGSTKISSIEASKRPFLRPYKISMSKRPNIKKRYRVVIWPYIKFLRSKATYKNKVINAVKAKIKNPAFVCTETFELLQPSV
ncbi:hypothetical protein BpHYR1_034354 [Brachionus plicatilis]|uniref:Uncharacterized protein n=1 Tax=Brachionus plicatilis TaxID=10195 RepID=A0A3M7PHF9_BRAPC|nr:hypothetical protein BpHYR1_034354 [Brachionus plicatilis]